jgi:O-glycosyl hydrolase
MNKHTYIFLRAAFMALALLCALGACDMGYERNQKVIIRADALAPVILEQPQDGIGIDLDLTGAVELELSVEAILPPGAEGTLLYQWYQYFTYRAYEEQAGLPLEGETGTTYKPPTGVEGEYHYYVVVTNYNAEASGRQTASVKSDSSTITINDPRNAGYPKITKHPSGKNLSWSTVMELPELTVEASVAPYPSDELRYQWYVTDTASNIQGVMIEGATTTKLTPPMALPGQEAKKGWINGAGDYYYFCVVTNYWFDAPGRRESSVASNPALVSVSANSNADTPVIAAQPVNALYFLAETVNPLTVTVDELTDGGILSYQWYSTTSNMANKFINDIGEGGKPLKTGKWEGTAIEEAVSPSYLPDISNSTPGRYFYYVVVTNTNGYAANDKTASTASSVAEVAVARPASGTANATFSVQFSGNNQYQYVRGFGGMDVAWGNFPGYNHPDLPAPQNVSDDYESLFNPDILGCNMLRIMILPTYTDINRTLRELVGNEIYTNKDSRRFYDNVKTVNRYGGYVLASPWSPPAAWKTNNSINGGGSLRPSDYQNFANYLRAFAQNMLNNGAPVYAVSISNEPNYVAGYDGCEWSNDEMMNFFRQVGRFTEGVAGFGGGKAIDSVKTMNGESANDPSINASAMGTPAAKRNIDLLARHNYGSRDKNGTQWIYHATDPREVWMTEHNLNSNSGATYPNDHTWNYIWVFMNDIDMSIRINHESAWIWWAAKRFYSMIGDETYGSKDGEILPRGWGLAHYAKFAKESYRVGVGYTGTTRSGAALAEDVTINGSTTANFESVTVKVSAYVKLRGGEVYPVNWSNRDVDISEIAEITMVMFTPTKDSGSDGYDMGRVRLQLPSGFRISSAVAMRSNPSIFDSGTTNRGTPQWETVAVTEDRNAAYVELPRSNILSVRFTQ